MASKFRGTVECYGCHQQVSDLAQHRAVCVGKNAGSKLAKRSTTSGAEKGIRLPAESPSSGSRECYGCHQQVIDLKEHKKVCTGSTAGSPSTGTSPSQLAGSPSTQGKECYGCHQQVLNLKEHKKVCAQSSAESPSHLVAGTRDVYFLIDVSGSMNGTKLQNAKNTITALYADMPENDRIAIVAFDDGAFFKLRPRAAGQIKRQDEMPSILGKMFAKGKTALYDAIWISVDQIRDKSRSTLIIVVTDGEDNSSKHSYHEVIDLVAKHENVTLNIIHITAEAHGLNIGSNLQYANLCAGAKGEYLVVEETEIVTTVTTVFKKYYALV